MVLEASNVLDKSDGPGLEWFCIRSQRKHEHIAACHLRKELGLEVYLPRIRFRRSTREGPMWFTEALFPGYLFARFELWGWLRRVEHARGVQGIVHFGAEWPSLPASTMEELRRCVGVEDLCIIDPTPRPGDAVIISGGLFHGLQAVVTQVMAGPERVRVLLEMLGRQTAVELEAGSVLKERRG